MITRYMVTAYAGDTVVKSIIVKSKDEAFSFVHEWLEQGYSVRVER